MGIFLRRFIFGLALLVSFVQIANAAAQRYGNTSAGVTWCVSSDPTQNRVHKQTAENFPDSYFQLSSSGNNAIERRSIADGSYQINYISNTGGSYSTDYCESSQFSYDTWYTGTLYPSTYTYNPSDFGIESFQPFTPEQCEEFGGLTGDTVQQSQYTAQDIPLGGTGCYKGCTVSRPFLGGESWSIGSLTFNEVQYTGGSCESIQPEEKDGCFEYQDNYLNWHQVCSVPPDVQPEDPEYPEDGSDPQDCLNVFDDQGTVVYQICDPEPEQENSCWLDQGQIYCAGFSAEGYSCTKINGASSCSYTGGGGVIDPDSVDHPDNGGNGDGDPTNDIFEPDASGNVAGGGYGHGGSGNYTQTAPSTSDKLLASDIGSSVAENIAGLVLSDSIDIGDGSAIEGHASGLDALGTSFVDAIGQSEIVGISNQLTSALSQKTGNCPAFSFTIDFLSIGEVGTDLHCQFANDYGTVIKALMLFVYIIMFIRIVMGA
jgi:hypothetical protein